MAYLSLSETSSPDLTFTTVSPDENEEMLQNDYALRFKWRIWEQTMPPGDESAAYADATRQVASFSSVQGFWKLWNHMPQPSGLLEQKRMVRERPDGDHVIDAIMIFRDNVRPEWEDKLNATGGHFQFKLKPSVGGGQVDEYWNNLVLGVVGATIEPADMITGIRLVDKLSGPRAANVIRLEVWFRDLDDTAAVQQLRRNIEKCMATRLDGSLGTAPKCETRTHQEFIMDFDRACHLSKSVGAAWTSSIQEVVNDIEDDYVYDISWDILRPPGLAKDFGC
eukprot:CAMPEP_0198500498 /NCGR_PEP_ID=MMETSP1462-20131121/8192_1 /TAXON_ID=1333877 /ORGANISM="Brandtodinium nutriculum, Strain RCC3387" /LENGTH=279 /DNA_ID=CAMNT_0044229507 /DNA_START=66 /DNA_END=905 /DNA_ORIENTATION=+